MEDIVVNFIKLGINGPFNLLTFQKVFDEDFDLCTLESAFIIDIYSVINVPSKYRKNSWGNQDIREVLDSLFVIYLCFFFFF